MVASLEINPLDPDKRHQAIETLELTSVVQLTQVHSQKTGVFDDEFKLHGFKESNNGTKTICIR